MNVTAQPLIPSAEKKVYFPRRVLFFLSEIFPQKLFCAGTLPACNVFPRFRDYIFLSRCFALNRERLTGFEIFTPVRVSLGLFLPRKLGRKVFDFADFLSGRFASLPLDTMNYILTTPKMQVLFKEIFRKSQKPSVYAAFSLLKSSENTYFMNTFPREPPGFFKLRTPLFYGISSNGIKLYTNFEIFFDYFQSIYVSKILYRLLHITSLSILKISKI